jgi:2-methylcitrate dehydratase PrpD
LQIVAEYHPVAEEVAEVECQTGPSLPQILIHHRPRTPLEGKFSMEYCLARALLDGRIGIGQFAEEKILDRMVQELLQRVRYVHTEGAETERQPEVVTVRLKNGRYYAHEVSVAKGAPENPMTMAELTAKYRDCASLVLPLEVVERSRQMVNQLEEVSDIAELADLLTSKTQAR